MKPSRLIPVFSGTMGVLLWLGSLWYGHLEGITLDLKNMTMVVTMI